MEKTKESNEIKEENKTTQGVNLDTIFANEIGQSGLYQIRMLMLLAIMMIFIAFGGNGYIFTTARIPTRCLISECEHRDAELQFRPNWILNAVPAAGDSFDNCQRFANVSISEEVDAAPDTCPPRLFDQNTLVDCDEYVYENTNSVVYEFDLACDEWRRTMIGFVRSLAALLALPLTGFISDRWGRRTALTFTAFNSGWIGVTRYFADTYVGFTINEFVECAFGSGAFSCSYIILLELVAPNLRVAAGASLNTFYALGQVLVGLVAMFVPYWRHLVLALYAPQLLAIAYLWIIPESVRWYVSKGRYEDSERVLKDIARVNGRELSEKSLKALRQTAEEEKIKMALQKENKTKTKEPLLIVLVFRYKPILLRCVVTPILWITMTLVYWGMNINAVNIAGNRYVNYMAVAAVEIPGYWLSFLLMGIIGRKPVLAGAFWICAACQIGYIFMPDGMPGVSLTLYLIGKCSISTVVTSLYVYTTELYPTQYRHQLFAFSSMIGRLGSIVAPLTPAFGDNIPFILFGSFALVAGLLVLLVPETLGAKLPNTMEEAANIGKKKVKEISKIGKEMSSL